MTLTFGTLITPHLGNQFEFSTPFVFQYGTDRQKRKTRNVAYLDGRIITAIKFTHETSSLEWHDIIDSTKYKLPFLFYLRF